MTSNDERVALRRSEIGHTCLMENVQVRTRDPHSFAAVVGPQRANELALVVGAQALARLHGRTVVNVNSTAAGGGVAEMLHVLLGYVRGVGIDTSWLVIEGQPDFFDVTKRLHNHLYGTAGDGGTLGPSEHQIYEATLAPERDALASYVRPGDIVILHDPQPAGLAEHAKKLGCHVVWRCHVGIEEQNEHSRVGWDFLRPYLEPFVDHYVFTDRRFPPDWVPDDRYTTIWPSIDPFSPKNQDMAPETVEAILTHVGLIAGRQGDTTFVHTDGSPGQGRADVRHRAHGAADRAGDADDRAGLALGHHEGHDRRDGRIRRLRQLRARRRTGAGRAGRVGRRRRSRRGARPAGLLEPLAGVAARDPADVSSWCACRCTIWRRTRRSSTPSSVTPRS